MAYQDVRRFCNRGIDMMDFARSPIWILGLLVFLAGCAQTPNMLTPRYPRIVAAPSPTRPTVLPAAGESPYALPPRKIIMASQTPPPHRIIDASMGGPKVVPMTSLPYRTIDAATGAPKAVLMTPPPRHEKGIRRGSPSDAVILDSMIAKDAQGWIMNSYVPRSLHNVAIVEDTATKTVMKGDYFYNKTERGWVRATTYKDRKTVPCLEYHDEPGLCRPVTVSRKELFAELLRASAARPNNASQEEEEEHIPEPPDDIDPSGWLRAEMWDKYDPD